jgi:hypothetical protein
VEDEDRYETRSLTSLLREGTEATPAEKADAEMLFGYCEEERYELEGEFLKLLAETQKCR